MNKWLEKYSNGDIVQQNYNNTSVSLPEGFVGMGYNTKGRNYSPAWGGQFEEGGFLPKAQKGKIVVTNPNDPKLKASRSDSIAVYNQNNKVLNYYNNNKKDYRKKIDYDTPETPAIIEANNLGARKATADNPNYEHNTPQGDRPIKLNEYYQKYDKNTYFQRELAAAILDTNAPFQLFDKRISPTKSYGFENINPTSQLYGDTVSIYGYDPILVKPVDLLTPEEIRIRLKKYGKNSGIAQPPVKKPVQPVVLQKEQEYPLVNKNIYKPKLKPGRITVPQMVTDEVAPPITQPRFPKGDYDYIFGPANSVIGRNYNGQFYSEDMPEQRGKVNQPDLDLLNNQEALKKYVQNKGLKFAMGGSLPGSVGFTYARTAGSAPSNGPYAKKTMPSAQDGWVTKAANAEFSCAANPRSNLNQSYSEYCNPKKGLDKDEYKALKNELSSSSMKDLLNVEEYYVLKNLADNQNRKMGRMKTAPDGSLIPDDAYSKYFDQSTGLVIPNLTTDLKEEGNLRATNRMYPGRKNLLVNDVYQGILKDYNITTPQTPAQTKALLEKAYNIGYAIPKQQDGGSLPKAQRGGQQPKTRTDVYTDKVLYDKAFAAETDSLNLYNNAKRDFYKFKKLGDRFGAPMSDTEWKKAFDQYDRLLDSQQKKWHTWPYKDEAGEKYIPGYTANYKYKGPKSGLKIKPVGLEGFYREGYDFPRFKKPVVHNVYKEEKAELLKSDRTAFNPQITQLQNQSINLSTIQNLPYRVEYYDGDINGMTHKNFIDEKAGSEFMKELQNRSYGIPYGVEAYYENTPKKEDGGWLNQYQDGGEEPLTKSSADWYKQWYQQRQALPQFSRVAEERLKLLSTLPKVQLTPLEELYKKGAVGEYIKDRGNDASQDIISLADPATVQAFAKKIGKSVDVNIGTDPSVVRHEMSHWFDARAKQSIFKPRGISKSEPYQRYPYIKPSMFKKSGLSSEDYKWITSEDASQFGTQFGTGIKTEVNSVLNELRQKEGFRGDQPTTPEQLQKIIDKYMNLPESDLDGGTPKGSENQRIRTLIKYMGGNPEKLSELNNTIVAIEKEDVPIAKHGDWLSKYDEGGEISPNCDPKYSYHPVLNPCGYKPKLTPGLLVNTTQQTTQPYNSSNFRQQPLATESTAITFFDPVAGKIINTATTGQTKESLDASTRAMGKTRKRDIEEEKQRVAERKAAVATKDKGKPFTLPTGETKKFEDMTTREQFYVSGKALENRGRFFDNEESIFDDINPLNWLGSMAGALGTAPYQAKQTDSYMPYVSAVANPLLMGRLMGSGSINPFGKKFWTNEVSNPEFLNNMAGGIPNMVKNVVENPIARNAAKVYNEVAQSMESGMLSKLKGVPKPTSVSSPNNNVRLEFNPQRSNKLNSISHDIHYNNKKVGEVSGNYKNNGDFEISDVGVDKAFQKKGISKQAYTLLNEAHPNNKVVSFGAYNTDAVGVQPGRNLWESLVREGKAKKVGNSYEMLDNKNISSALPGSPNVVSSVDDVGKSLLNFKKQFESGNVQRIVEAGGGRNKGIYEVDGKIVKLTGAGKGAGNAEELKLLSERIKDMPNVHAPQQTIKVITSNKKTLDASIMTKAPGKDASTLTSTEIESIPKIHWDKFEQDTRLLSEKGIQTDFTKQSNLFYDKKSGFHFIDIGGASKDGTGTGKFFMKNGVEYYVPFEKYKNLPLPFSRETPFTGGKNMFNNMSSLNKDMSLVPGSPNVSSVDDVVKQPWQMQELPGLHLKSTMEGEAISKIVEPKTGLINTEQALAIIGKESGGKEKADIIRQALGENIPKKIDYNDFRKTVQDQLIPLERQFSEQSSNYGLGKIGYPSSKRIEIKNYSKYNEEEIERLTNELKSNSKEPRSWDTNEQKRILQTELDNSIKQLNKSKEDFAKLPIENQTIILGNKNKFGKGSNAHGNPDETLGHIHFLRDAETPDVLTVTQIQADAFQGTNRTMPKSIDDAVSKLNKAKDDVKYTQETFGDEADKFQDVFDVANKHLSLEEATVKNFSQKSLLDKSHQERYIQELVNYAGERGDLSKIRLPTSETAAKIQNYEYKSADEITTRLKEMKEVNPDRYDKVYNEHKQFFDDIFSGKLKGTYDPEAKTILKKYSEQPKLIKKLYGVEPKIVTDSKGNSWYEFDIPKSFKKGKGEIKAFKEGGIIDSDRGQWDHPGKITRIKGGNITMKPDPKTGKALNKPLLGISNTGERKMMYPGQDYQFEDDTEYVTEYPMAKNGVRQEQKGLQNLDDLLNFTNYNKPQPGGWLNKYN